MPYNLQTPIIYALNVGVASNNYWSNLTPPSPWWRVLSSKEINYFNQASYVLSAINGALCGYSQIQGAINLSSISLIDVMGRSIAPFGALLGGLGVNAARIIYNLAQIGELELDSNCSILPAIE
ncbi:MAG: hypothetical protein M9931_00695 [Chitinophagales bacterium]|nr:hypothetical protein [Chitinophagales bacterium]